MTKGWRSILSGGDRLERAYTYSFVILTCLGLALAIVNSASVIDERAALNAPIQSWRAWTWEFTSFFSWLLLTPAILVTAAHFKPPQAQVATAIIVHLCISVLASLTHVALMVASRKLIYSLAGETNDFRGPLLHNLLYEYRKDLVTYTASVATFMLIHWGVRPPAPEALSSQATQFRLEVKDGNRTCFISPDDINWVEAAGNYVELHGQFGTLLHRQTLSSIEASLAGHGFARIHRSRVVRGASVASVATKPSGDFSVSLLDGTVLSGSRRYKPELSKVV